MNFRLLPGLEKGLIEFCLQIRVDDMGGGTRWRRGRVRRVLIANLAEDERFPDRGGDAFE